MRFQFESFRGLVLGFAYSKPDRDRQPPRTLLFDGRGVPSHGGRLCGAAHPNIQSHEPNCTLPSSFFVVLASTAILTLSMQTQTSPLKWQTRVVFLLPFG